MRHDVPLLPEECGIRSFYHFKLAQQLHRVDFVSDLVPHLQNIELKYMATDAKESQSTHKLDFSISTPSNYFYQVKIIRPYSQLPNADGFIVICIKIDSVSLMPGFGIYANYIYLERPQYSSFSSWADDHSLKPTPARNPINYKLHVHLGELIVEARQMNSPRDSPH